MVKDKELALLKLRQEAVMDSLNDGVILIDSDYNVIDVNKAFMTLFWIRERDLRGLKDSELYKIIESYFDDEYRDKISQLFKLVTGNTKLIGDDFEAKIIKPWEIFINVFTSPIYDDDKGFVGRIWKFENIHEKKLIDNMKTEFISIASHQLRTPLSAISGNIDMIMQGDFGEIPETVKESLLDVSIATENLLYLVNGLLDVSRLEMGKIEPEYSKENIFRLVRNVVHTFDNFISEKKLSVTIDVKKKLEFKVDKKLFTEALKNYVSNAVKYSPKGGVVIISAEIRKNDLYVEIMDEGIGVPKSQLDGLFTKFFRADNVRNKDFEGTGLGLYYVKKSIEAMNGDVGFRPGHMNGSVFYFKIPPS